MKYALIKFILLLVVLGGVVYFYQRSPNLLGELGSLVWPAPCTRPLTYTIGAIDPRFHLSQDQLRESLAAAESIWEKPYGHELFSYADNGKIKVNLIFDLRQEATNRLQSLGLEIKNDQSSYDALKARYDELQSVYIRDRSNLQSLVDVYQRDKQKYERDVDYWNSRGGAPEAEYRKLSETQKDLQNQIDAINKKQARLNEQAADLNALIDSLNLIAQSLNLQVQRYNNVGSLNGSEFEEGVYKVGSAGKEIDIYEFNNVTQLSRILSHEFGHALGLQHVSSTQAIMYRLNQSQTLTANQDDLAELRRACE